MTSNTDSTAQSSRIARRTLLRSLPAGAIALAGCSSNNTQSSTTSEPPGSSEPGQGSQTPTDESSVFNAIQIGTTHVQVELSDTESVSRVNLIDPDGALHSQSGVSTGATQVSLRLSDDWEFSSGGYTPGTYRLVAIQEGDIVDETEVNIQPDVQIADVLWKKNHPDEDWDLATPDPEDHALTIIENNGTGPTMVDEFIWEDTPQLLADEYDEERSYNQRFTLSPGESVRKHVGEIFATNTMDGAVACEDYNVVPFQLTLRLRVGNDATYSQAVQYGGEEYNCELSLVESEDSEGTTDSGGS